MLLRFDSKYSELDRTNYLFKTVNSVRIVVQIG